MSGEIYQIETRRRSRSKTPFLRSSCDHENCDHAGEEGHVHHKKKKSSAAPNVRTIVEEHVEHASTSSSSSISTTTTRSKGFTQLTSLYSGDEATPDAKRNQQAGTTRSSKTSTVTTMLTNTSQRLGNALHSLTAAATSTPRNHLETTQNVLNSAQERSRTNGAANLSPDHIAYIEYRDAGEYWNKTPKTDYTYSELSPHRRQLAPGIVAMPNMSRRSLANHNERVDFMVQQNPAQEEFIRRRYQANYTHLNYDSNDEVDITRFGQQKQSWWLVRFITFIVTSVSSTWSRITSSSSTTETNSYKNYYANQQRRQQQGLVATFVSSVYRYIYLGIASVLSLDTWLLKSGNAENKSKKRFLILLLLLLPLLLLAAWYQLPQEQRLELVQRGEALLPLPLTLLAAARTQLLQAGVAIKSLVQLPSGQTESEESAATIKLQMEQMQQNMRKSLTPEEYENILNHVNSYVQQLVELKLQQQRETQAQKLSPQQIQIIVQLMRENLQQFAEQKTQFSEQQLADLALQLKLQLQQAGEWQIQQPVSLTAAQLEEITRLIKAEVKLEENNYTLLLERIDLTALLKRLLAAPELTELVDSRIHLAINQKQEHHVEGSGGQQVNAQQIEQLNREIAFIKLALSDKHAENADLQQSISSLKLSQDDLLARVQQHELAQDQRFSGLLAEIESKLTALNESQFVLLNRQVKLTLVEMLGFKQAAGASMEDDVDLQNWVRSMFVAKEYLEQQLLELNQRTNNNIREEIERSSIVLMGDISERLKREILLSVEVKHNASVQAQKLDMQEQQVRDIVKSVLAIYDADKTGLVDFALESAGGQILSTRCTESYQTKSAQISVFGIPLWYPTNTPRVAISPNVQPGECWAFQGFPGFLVLKLNSLVHVTGFTLEHISKSLSPTGRIDSAPRNFTVWGLEHEKDQEPVLFGEYEYQDNEAALQYFVVQNADIKRPYEIVELRIETNHGHPDYTCLYRFRVHGKPPGA
ncbi:klaroid protein isoform X1 [Drosophila sulfurigaster albostrigata]|uniref:klaroid protein isoform X1 n=1 Tax=Drosophila sulfurigaster albostrigata TaxID=89887 RepID=UPI002D21A237|nr:klaroid protein isoform X1 [Drosophila sulfurigaster albostrigata]